MQGPAAPGPPAGPGTPSNGLDTAGTLLHCCWPGKMAGGNGRRHKSLNMNCIILFGMKLLLILISVSSFHSVRKQISVCPKMLNCSFKE